MAKKNKALRHQLQKQKKALQKTRRAKTLRKMHSPIANKVTELLFPDDKMRFWLTHGVNYILSDYKKGEWSPLFPAIYEGQPPPEAVDAISTAILAKYGQEGFDWPTEAKTAFAWTLQKRAVVYGYCRTAVRNLRDKNPGEDAEALAVQPHNPVVWELFTALSKSIAPAIPYKGTTFTELRDHDFANREEFFTEIEDEPKDTLPVPDGYPE